MPDCPVNSWNEWDPLEEVIVGTARGAHIPTARDLLLHDGDGNSGRGGTAHSIELIERVQSQLEYFVQVLEGEGIKVRRPHYMDIAAGVTTPHFSVPCGFNLMNARDLVMIVGNRIIETPTGARSRYFETLCYRELFKEYFLGGAYWFSAPKPELSDRSYYTVEVRRALNIPQAIVSEFEPLFDAADFVRCGRDIFCQRGAGTNRFGIRWLQQHLGPELRIHEVGTRCTMPMHIDTTFVPLGPGRVLVNPHWIGKLPDAVKGWEVFEAPDPQGETCFFQGFRQQTSPYIAMNVFLIDEKRIFVDAQQTNLIRNLKDWGFDPIAIPFDLPPFLGGAFHCVTLDVRRRGGLQSYG